MDVRQLIQLKIKGWSNRKIAEYMDVSRNTVNSYIQVFSQRAETLSELLELSDTQLLEFFPQVDRNTDAERYGYLSSRFEYYRSELTKTGSTLQTLWHEYQQECPDGYRYTQFVHHYRKWNKKIRSSGILVHRAGAELFIDFAGTKLSYTDMESGKQVPLEVFFNAERIAHHRRSYRPGHYTTVADHIPSTHQAYTSWNPQWFEKQAERIGPHTSTYISRLMEQYAYPEIGYKQAQGILHLAKHAGHERIERACERASTYHKAGYRIVENIIKHHLDATEVGSTHQHIPEHSNIRGASQYT